MLSHLIFVVLALFSLGLFSWKMRSIIKQIKLGQSINRTDRTGERIKTMLLVAFGQKKMFNRPIPAILHFIFYVAFIITQIELIEVFIDGFTGSHRFFYHAGLGAFYTFVISSIEVLSVLTFIATLIFFARRNLIKLPRFASSDLNGWARNDANLILLFELLLITFIFMMNSADEADNLLRSNAGYGFAISQYLGPLFFGRTNNLDLLHIISSIGWWGHLIMVFVFLNYLPYSKHLHILFAFPNTYFSNLNAKGKFNNMESVEAEVKLMLGEPSFIDKYSHSDSADDLTESWEYEELYLSISFDQAENWKLMMISVTSDFYELEEVSLIGLSEKKLIDQLDEIDLGDFFIEDCSENDSEDNKVIEIDKKSINFWLTSGVLDEIQWSPIFIDDDTIKWPK